LEFDRHGHSKTLVARELQGCGGAALSIRRPRLVRNCARERGPITTGSSWAKAGAPAIAITMACGYGSRIAIARLSGTTAGFVAAAAPLMRRQRNLVVDQLVQHRLDVGLAVDDACLLQGHAGGEDRVALRRADPAVGQLGALLE